jgi:hypothetical protein
VSTPRTNGGGFAGLFHDDGADPLDDKPSPAPKRSKRVRVADSNRHIGCPLWWFKLALSIMPHSSHELAVALYVYRLRIVHYSKTVSVSNERLAAELKVNRSAKYRALEKLAAAGVIRIRRRNKQAWTVTFIDRKHGSAR